MSDCTASTRWRRRCLLIRAGGPECGSKFRGSQFYNTHVDMDLSSFITARAAADVEISGQELGERDELLFGDSLAAIIFLQGVGGVEVNHHS
jgi:hypothetical protein